MKYFTDHTVENDWLLVKIKKYISLRNKKPEFLDKKKEVLVDPGVYDLTKSDKFSWEGTINIPEFLDSLPKNHYFACDYPCDMNINFTELFLKKSWNNAKKYRNHPQYIVTVQSRCFKLKKLVLVNDYSFYKWFDRYNKLHIESGILGIGNICIAHVNNNLKSCIKYAIENTNHPRMHIYGMKLKTIPFAYKLAKKNDIKISIDGTKWTRVVNKELREKMGEGHRSCRGGAERQLFFDEYMKEIRKRGVILE